MPGVPTRGVRKFVAKAKRAKENIWHYKWCARGYLFCIRHSDGFVTDTAGKYINGWHISAGCRRWSSFDQMRRHFGDHWHNMHPDRERLPQRVESLTLTRKLELFCQRHNITLAGERRKRVKKKNRLAR